MTGIAERTLPPAGRTGPPDDRSRMLRVVITVVLAGMTLVVFVLVQLARPVPSATLRLTTRTSRTLPGTLALPWPKAGEAYVEVDGVGAMGSSGPARSVPTASVAKVMTAYVFLQDHPLSSGQEGPTFTISAQEAARLPWRKARGETHVDVVAGQRFTEREALEALLIVSANNIAHELARWDSGSDAAFAAKMNSTARRLGMTGTHYTDPSGFDATTVSTAPDQAKLFGLAMRLPAFTEVVRKPAYVPRGGGPAKAGGDTLLGSYGVVGGKTGFTSQAGANFVFAARAHGRLVVGAVMSQPHATSPATAVDAARPLIVAAEKALTYVTVAPTGTAMGTADDGLGDRVRLVTASPVKVFGWPGLTVRLSVRGRLPAHPRAGQVAGVLTAAGTRTDLTLDGPLRSPSVLGRLFRF